jgi:hypothetical protein
LYHNFFFIFSPHLEGDPEIAAVSAHIFALLYKRFIEKSLLEGFFYE